MSLSPKLAYILSQIRPGSRVVDVGTDHAYLPIALWKKGITDRIIACDIGEKPLGFARANLQTAGCTGVDLRQSDGLTAVNEDEADTVILAGMGGEVIAGILKRCTYAANGRITFFLQPMTGAPYLRRYLAENGFAVVKEEAVPDNGHVYTVMTVRYTGVPYRLSPAGEQIGTFRGKTEPQKRYIAKRVSVMRSCLEAMERLPEKAEEVTYYKTALEEIKHITEEP